MALRWVYWDCVFPSVDLKILAPSENWAATPTSLNLELNRFLTYVRNQKHTWSFEKQPERH